MEELRDFGWAIRQLKEGKKVAREGWNGNKKAPNITPAPTYRPLDRIEYVESLDLVYLLLSDGSVAVCDGVDYEKVSQKSSWSIGSGGYPYASFYKKGKQTNMRLHNFIYGNIPDGYVVDHINGDKLDNRRVNLRLATSAQNNQNRVAKSGTSKYKGVSYDSSRSKWIASIQTNGKTKHIGRFNKEVEAAIAYDKEAHRRHGSFAKLNFTEKTQEPSMWIVLMPSLYLPPYNTANELCKVNDRTAKHIGEDKPLDSQPYISMWTASEQWQPGWLASQSDILSEDWVIVE